MANYSVNVSNLSTGATVRHLLRLILHNTQHCSSLSEASGPTVIKAPHLVDHFICGHLASDDLGRRAVPTEKIAAGAYRDLSCILDSMKREGVGELLYAFALPNFEYLQGQGVFEAVVVV